MSPSFGTWDNGLTLLLNGAVIAFLALGQTFVLLTGGIDLSTGANVAMTGVLATVSCATAFPGGGLPAGGRAGLVLGVINGIVIHYVKVPPFIVNVLHPGRRDRGPLIITGANSISVRQAGFSWIGQGRVAGIPLRWSCC